jgi:hypothetical protein
MTSNDSGRQSQPIAGNTYRNIVIRDDARAQLGNINAPVTVTGKLILSQ